MIEIKSRFDGRVLYTGTVDAYALLAGMVSDYRYRKASA